MPEHRSSSALALTPREERLLSRRRERPELAWAEPFHEAWVQGNGLPRCVRLARSIRAQWRESRPVVEDDELVLGRFGIRSAVWHSEYGGLHFDLSHWRELRDEDGRTPDECALLDEIRGEWEGRDFPGRVAARLREQGLTGDIPGTSLGAWSGHSCQDYSLFLRAGARGVRERIARARAANPSAGDWYDSLEEIVAGVCEFAAAVRRSALSAAKEATVPERREELLGTAAVLERCPEHPVSTFREAVQTFWILFLLNGADSCSRLDQDLGPYLDRDLAAGRITEAQAREMISSLWVRLDEYRSWSAVVGGTDVEGRDACNTFTRMAIEATGRLRTQAPNLCLRVHSGLPDDILALACRVIAAGGGMPSLVNDEPIIESLVARGVALEDARDYALTGCAQVFVPGCSYGGYEDFFPNALKWLELALHNGHDPLLGRQVGPLTGSSQELRTFDDVVRAFEAQMAAVLDTGCAVAATNLRVLADEFPSALRSVLGHDTVERGVDIRAGGYRYNEGLVDILGMTNVADSLAVIRELVFEREEMSLPDLIAILDANWEGHEGLRQRCLASGRSGFSRDAFPKFGNDDPEHDALLASLYDLASRDLRARFTEVGQGCYSYDVVGWTGHVAYGAVTAASPDGRRSGEPLADSCGASQGRDVNGPTALLASAARLGHRRAHGVVALTLRFAPNVGTDTRFASAGAGLPLSRDAKQVSVPGSPLVSLVRTYFGMGGQQLQLNVVDNRVLRDAQEHPERYESLVVRVGGFSAYWNQLGREMQEAIISRSEHVL